MHHAAIGAAVLLLAEAAAAGQMTLYSLATDGRFVELGRDGCAGNIILWNSAIQDEQSTSSAAAPASASGSTRPATICATW